MWPVVMRATISTSLFVSWMSSDAEAALGRLSLHKRRSSTSEAIADCRLPIGEWLFQVDILSRLKLTANPELETANPKLETSAMLMPAIFFGHGNPLNAIQRNVYTEGWSAIGNSLPRPRAILCISAHWYFPATAVTAMPAPRTIHDFGGFPRE